VRRVSASEHPDLFFALRGGKGAAGIVTAVELDLLEMDSFYGGALYFDGGDAAAVLHRWRTWSSQLPEEATTSFALLQLPDLPFVPPPLAGKLTLSVRFVWTGDTAAGERAIEEMRAVAPVLIDDVALKPFAAFDSVHADPVDPLPGLENGTLLSSFTAETVDTLLAVAGPGSASPQVIAEVRQLGGALARSGEYPCAVSHRAAAFSVLLVGMAPVPGSAEHAASALAALAPWEHEGTLPNWTPASDAATARRAYDAATLQRLAEVVATYDPAGVVAGAAYVRAAAQEAVVA
jgi:FAD/FMN-containing dehydrogenase